MSGLALKHLRELPFANLTSHNLNVLFSRLASEWFISLATIRIPGQR